MADRIRDVYSDECAGCGDAIVRQVCDRGATSAMHALTLASRTGYSVGLEIGLAIAITDIAAARQLQAWIVEQVQRGDPLAADARDRQAANYLRVLR